MKLGFKLEKVRVYFDNSLFPRDLTLKVMDIDPNLEDFLSPLDISPQDEDHLDPCKIYKDLFQSYDRC